MKHTRQLTAISEGTDMTLCPEFDNAESKGTIGDEATSGSVDHSLTP